MPMMGTMEYRRVLNSGGFWVKGFDVARERRMRDFSTDQHFLIGARLH